MAYLNNQLPRIQATVPVNGALEVKLTDPIKIVFNTYMDQTTINSSNMYLEIDGKTYGTPDVQINVSYDATSKTATLTPVNPLEPATIYRLIVTRNVKSSLGTSPAEELNNVTFTTTKVGYLPAPKLVSPSNSSLIKISTPTLSWEGVAGATRYHVQISSNKNFDTIVWESEDVVDTSVACGTELVVGDNTAQFYFWRVRAYDNSATPMGGVWSQVWAFNDAVYTNDPAALENFSLDIMSVSPQVDATLVPLTSVISVEFTEPIDDTTVTDSTFYVSYKAVDGDPSVVGGKLSGTINVDGKVITLTPSSKLLNNMEYTVVVTDDVKGVSGLSLAEDTMWTFTSAMTPMYAGPEIIRNDIGSFVSSFSDNDINKMILDVSRWADMIAANEYGTTLDYVKGTTNAYYYTNYVRYEAELRLLNRKILEISESQGSRTRLGELEVQKDTSLIPDINTALKPIQVKAREFEQLLRDAPKAKPVSVLQGGEYPYNSRQW